MILALQTEVKEFKAVEKIKKMGKHGDKGDTIRSGRDEWKWKWIPPGDLDAKMKKQNLLLVPQSPHFVFLHKASECKLNKEGTNETKKKSNKFSMQQLKMSAYQSLFESSNDEEVVQEESTDSVNETKCSNTSEWLGPELHALQVPIPTTLWNTPTYHPVQHLQQWRTHLLIICSVLIVMILIRVHSPMDYQPYKPWAQWRKWAEKTINKCWRHTKQHAEGTYETVISYLPSILYDSKRKKYCSIEQSHQRTLNYKKFSSMWLLCKMVLHIPLHPLWQHNQQLRYTYKPTPLL